jgi:DNA-binding transcriptional LysR family regulator
VSSGYDTGSSEIDIDDLRDQKIISFSRSNLAYTERYFASMFEEHDLTKNIAYTCDDTFSLVSPVSAGLGIGFAPEWTEGMPNRNFRAPQGEGRRLPHRSRRRLERAKTRKMSEMESQN